MTWKEMRKLIRQRLREGWRYEVNAVGSMRAIPPPNWKPFRRDSGV